MDSLSKFDNLGGLVSEVGRLDHLVSKDGPST